MNATEGNLWLNKKVKPLEKEGIRKGVPSRSNFIKTTVGKLQTRKKFIEKLLKRKNCQCQKRNMTQNFSRTWVRGERGEVVCVHQKAKALAGIAV